MRTSKKLLIALSAIACASCVTLTDKAAKIQVHSQQSTLLSQCKNLGPVNARSSRIWDEDTAITEAKVKLREMTADKGGDTVVVVNTDVLTTEVAVQGVALRCY